MRDRKLFLLILFTALYTGIVSGETTEEINEAFIKEERLALEQTYGTRVEQIKKESNALRVLESNMEANRLVFEKDLHNETMAFVGNLIRLENPARNVTWKNFRLQQELKRKEFLANQDNQRLRFRQEREKEREKYKKIMQGRFGK